VGGLLWELESRRGLGDLGGLARNRPGGATSGVRGVECGGGGRSLCHGGKVSVTLLRMCSRSRRRRMR